MSLSRNARNICLNIFSSGAQLPPLEFRLEIVRNALLLIRRRVFARTNSDYRMCIFMHLCIIVGCWAATYDSMINRVQRRISRREYRMHESMTDFQKYRNSTRKSCACEIKFPKANRKKPEFSSFHLSAIATQSIAMCFCCQLECNIFGFAFGWMSTLRWVHDQNATSSSECFCCSFWGKLN